MGGGGGLLMWSCVGPEDNNMIRSLRDPAVSVLEGRERERKDY